MSSLPSQIHLDGYKWRNVKKRLRLWLAVTRRKQGVRNDNVLEIDPGDSGAAGCGKSASSDTCPRLTTRIEFASK
ncbi:unnamed protein product [Caenorhabditis auriculariae]|uniref:Uncharacterized protein n=1 Tax=Caenorhabditis auriculariae TaxID=2777116 RepID=A0A8S1HPV4_9PELO|nr:unnamed protein product [Caenorhabditis auriculariae]